MFSKRCATDSTVGAVALGLSVASVMFYQITGNSKMSQPALQDPTGMFWVSDTSSLLPTIYLDQISAQTSSVCL